MRIFTLFIFFIYSLAACNNEGKDQSQDAELFLDSLETEREIELEISELETQLITQGLVNVSEEIPSIMVDLKYSTTNNFFGADVYGDFDKAFLQKEVVMALSDSQEALKEENENLSLYIFDAVRPLSIQQILWDALDSIPPNVRKAYVADPAEGSIHNFGCAVDLSIYDIAKDSLLDMGTDYDFFGYLAYPRKENEMLAKGLLTISQIDNRKLLRDVMDAGGFMPITSEWWHFNKYSRVAAKNKYGIVK